MGSGRRNLTFLGGLDVWKEKLAQKSDFKVVRTWGKRARSWNDPEQLLEAMASISRLDSDTGPLQTYLTLSEIDARRPAGTEAVARNRAPACGTLSELRHLVSSLFRIS